MRMINDYRGVGTGANCAFSRVWLRGMPALVIVVTAPVACGQELLLDYGTAYWERVRRLASLPSDAASPGDAALPDKADPVTDADLLLLEQVRVVLHAADLA